MNKAILFIAAVAIFGCVAFAQEENPEEALTKFSAFGNDESEVSRLPDEKQVFRDFCLNVRDDLKVYLKQTANSQAAKLFELISTLFAESAIRVGAQGVAAAAEAKDLINEDARNTKQGVSMISQALINAGKVEFKEHLESFKASADGENAVSAIQRVCNEVTMTLRPKYEDQLTAVKKDIARSSKGEFAKLLKETKLNNLGCTTTGRLSLVSRGCELLTAVLPTLHNFF